MNMEKGECFIVFKCGDRDGSCSHYKDERNEGECRYCFGGNCTNRQAQREEFDRAYRIYGKVEEKPLNKEKA
jgi:dienelactone hydrolase